MRSARVKSRRELAGHPMPDGVVKQEFLGGKSNSDVVERLMKYFPDEFALPDETESSHSADDEPGTLCVSDEYLLGLMAGIERELARLAPLREQVAEIEAIKLDAKIKAAALPSRQEMDTLLRYETAIDRKQDRAYARLERLQKRRREKGG